jgi:hypothetical protein
MEKIFKVFAKGLFVLILFSVCAGKGFTQTMEALFLEVNGRVEIRESSSPEWRRAEPGNLIGKDTLISTGLKSSAVISLGSSRLDIRPLTVLTLEDLVRRGDGEETILYLRTGRIRAEVTPPTGQNVDFTVGSPTVTASVRGTSFEFDGRRLWVESGLVLLAGSGGQKIYVAQAQKSYVDENNQNRIVPPFEAEAAVLRPVIPELTNIGSAVRTPETGGSSGSGSGFGLRIELNWPQ